MSRLLVGLLIIVPLLAAGVLLWHGPIAQEQAYHAFVDQRAWAGVANAGDVLSNLPFLLVGGVGLWLVWRAWGRELAPAYGVFFLGTALTAFGSGYYHLAPTDATLFWDRLPMTLIFTAFVAIVTGECLGARLGARLLWPLVVLGVTSAVVWRATGDLRLYVFAQFVPMVFLPLLLLLRPPAVGARWFWGVLGCYALSKGLEAADAPVYHAGHGLLSGHSLKHIAAALATACLLPPLRRAKD